jgi:hypothetical protein
MATGGAGQKPAGVEAQAGKKEDERELNELRMEISQNLPERHRAALTPRLTIFMASGARQSEHHRIQSRLVPYCAGILRAASGISARGLKLRGDLPRL